MSFRTLRDCVDDLAATGQLLAIDEPVDPYLEAAEIHRRVNQAGGPALLFRRPQGCRFPLVSNVFGTIQRARYLFRDTLATVQALVDAKVDPTRFRHAPLTALHLARAAWQLRPQRVRHAPVLACQTTLDQLPQVVCWPRDGGPFVTLPQVYTEDPLRPGWRHSNLGMYRVQLAGNQYRTNEEVGLHYQIHRGIGVHHALSLEAGQPLRVHVLIGGPPALAVAAVMPLPEGLPEVAFAGVLGGRRLPLHYPASGELPVAAEADFCITGTIDPSRQLPEGPFGDHLGYYSLVHDFPVLRVERVTHRPDAIWPFTVVGRPPQEDTAFGQLIHELTGPIIPTVVPGVSAVHAVDAAGVHPLLLALGSERYVPYAPRQRPQELLTQAHAILGQGQMSLAKYLLIASQQDDPNLDLQDVPAFFHHLLRRIDWRRDAHFETCTTIDTLDYSGDALNQGSKVVWAAVGPPQRDLPTEIPGNLRLPDTFFNPRICLPGVLAVQGPAHAAEVNLPGSLRSFCAALQTADSLCRFPLVVLVDDSRFVSQTLNNFLWTTFTRSNPAVDIDGVGAFTQHKHWGCAGSLVIDARAKAQHAPALEPDPEVSRRVDRLCQRGGPLFGFCS